MRPFFRVTPVLFWYAFVVAYNCGSAKEKGSAIGAKGSATRTLSPVCGKATRWGTPMFGIVTAFEGLHVTVEIQERKHVAHMRQGCGLGS